MNGTRQRKQTCTASSLAGVLSVALLGSSIGLSSGVGAAILLHSNVASAPLGEKNAEAPSAVLPLLPWNALPGDFTLLLLGVDATGEEKRDSLRANSDTMLLVRLEPSTGKLFALSIPRDTRVPIPGHGTFKINAAQTWGGTRLAAQTVANFLNVPIHRYLAISLSGVIRAIDAVDGVDVTIPKAIDYDDRAGHLHIHLKPGRQHLSGTQAEAYLRFRKDDIGSDIGRVQRQQAFFLETAKQFLRPATILKLPELWPVLQQHLETNLTPQEFFQVAGWARQLDFTGDSALVVLPGRYETIRGSSYWIANPDELASFLAAHFREAATVPLANKRRPRLAIWDASGSKLDLEPLERHLRAAGYTIWAIDRRRLPAEHSRLIIQRGDIAAGRELAHTLGISEIFPAAVGDLNSDYTIEIGTDWPAIEPAAKQLAKREQ
ncbi:MAG: LCP family protein [Cyanobacteria bacterium NC_groundwater_1444_Ag_S-0.65um_54_12]|nr:LCP family protein [Cyanobacteria bacterium NC_groundwater_1444_Ag_S-0.65um_54_12]